MSRLHISSELNKIAKAIADSKGRGILVGGAVRDHFLDQRISKDLDLEVFGLSIKELESVLQDFGNIHAAVFYKALRGHVCVRSSVTTSTWCLTTSHFMKGNRLRRKEIVDGVTVAEEDTAEDRS